jgi:predicted nucleic acid-binding protein
MTTAFLLDTCVISETNLPDPDLRVIRFLEETEKFYLPAGALIEIMMGITMVCATSPTKAVKLSAWYHQLMKSGLPILETGRDVIEIMGVLIADSKLRNLWDRPTDKFGKVIGRSRGGQDVHIAAAALAHRLPIATMNVADFMLINSYYPLAGIYDPKAGIWHARMEPLAERFPIEQGHSETLPAYKLEFSR